MEKLLKELDEFDAFLAEQPISHESGAEGQLPIKEPTYNLPMRI